MALKKKFHGGLKVLLLLLFIMLLGMYSICYADEPDYFDFEFPVEFFDALLEYTNSNINLQPQGLTTTVTGLQLKTFFDGNIKEDLKTKCLNAGASEQNIMVLINNRLNNSSQRGLRFFFVLMNNTIGDVDNETTFITSNISADGGLVFRPDTSINTLGINISQSGTLSKTSSLGTYYFSWKYLTENVEVTTGDFFIYNNGPFFGVNPKPLNLINANLPYNNTYTYYFINGFYNINPVSDTPSGDIPIDNTTGVITNTSGETTGRIDLTNIENGITNIQNQISGDSQKIINTLSGETQKLINNQTQNTNTIINFLSGDANFNDKNITSGDIENSLGFKIAEDPYSNFWLTLTNNLKSALLGVNRSIDVSFQDRTWTISLDEYFVLPTWLTIILIPISTAFFTWILARQWKHIFDKLSSGNIDSLLKENSEERYF